MSIGWVKLHRSIKDWEWYGDINCRLLMVHLIITVNYKDTKWQGHTIKRGQRVIGRIALAEEVGLSEQTIRTCLTRLKSTSEVTIKSTNRFSLLTLVKYNYYQAEEQPLTSQLTSQPTSNQPATNQQLTTSKECKNIKNKEFKKREEQQAAPIHPQNNNLPDSTETPKPKKKLVRFTPPTLAEATQYFLDKGDPNYQDEADGFINFYESNGWLVGKNKMKKWKAAASGWMKRNRQGNFNGAHQQSAKRMSLVERVEQACVEDNAQQEFDESIVGENDQGVGLQANVGFRGDSTNGVGRSSEGDDWPDDKPWLQ